MSPIQLQRCAGCGREVGVGAHFCPGCGRRLRSAPVSPASARPATPTIRPGRPTNPPVRSAAGKRFAMTDLKRSPVLGQVDEWIRSELGLGHAEAFANLPTVLCETAEEFYGALFMTEPLSAVQWKELLDQEVAAANQQAREGGGTFGVFLPGQGCLVNGWLFQQLFGLAKASDALSDPASRQHAIGTAVHEKWGHGYISTHGALGGEAQSLSLDRYRYARSFPKLSVTTPEGVVLEQKWSALFSATNFAEEGWATWIERHVLSGFAGATAARRGSLEEVDTSGLPDEAAVSLREVLDDGVSVADATAAMGRIERAAAALNPWFEERFGQPAPYVLGYEICKSIERRFGSACVAPAVLIAMNVTYSLATISVSDLLQVVTSDSRMNVNHRLVALLHMPASDVVRTPEGLARCAHDQLGFSIPQELAHG